MGKDIVTLEEVEKDNESDQGAGVIPYEERLHLGLFSLEKRQVKGDMIEVYKIMHGVENVDRETFFSLSQNTRTQGGHPMKLIGGRSRTNKGKQFFTQHIVKL